MEEAWAKPLVEAASGAILATTPWWVNVVTGIDSLARGVTLLCGTVIAVHGVVRICRGYWQAVRRSRKAEGD